MIRIILGIMLLFVISCNAKTDFTPDQVKWKKETKILLHQRLKIRDFHGYPVKFAGHRLNPFKEIEAVILINVGNDVGKATKYFRKIFKKRYGKEYSRFADYSPWSWKTKKYEIVLVRYIMNKQLLITYSLFKDRFAIPDAPKPLKKK